MTLTIFNPFWRNFWFVWSKCLPHQPQPHPPSTQPPPWSPTSRHIFPCVNQLCKHSPALAQALLSSTLSHAQVCSTIVDRISSALPVFPC